MSSGFDLDLNAVEDELAEAEDGDGEQRESNRRVVLGVLDGTTDGEEWFEIVNRGHALVLAIEGDLSELAAGFAPEVKEHGGELVHFRDFLLVTPADVTVDTERL